MGHRNYYLNAIQNHDSRHLRHILLKQQPIKCLGFELHDLSKAFSFSSSLGFSSNSSIGVSLIHGKKQFN